MPGVVRAAHAKVNLWLQVTGRRGDGYHLLDSLVVFAGLADRVEIDLADRASLSIDGPFADALVNEPGNIVQRAIELVAARLGHKPTLAVRLSKNIPVAAGLGGGSSDAAATLLALRELWRWAPGTPDLQAAAAGLGADVPMCLVPRPVLVGGVGEKLRQAVTLPPCAMVLVNPRVPLPTPDVFRALAAMPLPARQESDPAQMVFPDLATLAAAIEARGNDLTEAASRHVPEITAILAELRRAEGVKVAAMSGSGATCFALLADQDQAAAAATAITSRRPAWWIWHGPVLSGSAV